MIKSSDFLTSTQSTWSKFGAGSAMPSSVAMLLRLAVPLPWRWVSLQGPGPPWLKTSQDLHSENIFTSSPGSHDMTDMTSLLGCLFVTSSSFSTAVASLKKTALIQNNWGKKLQKHPNEPNLWDNSPSHLRPRGANHFDFALVQTSSCVSTKKM